MEDILNRLRRALSGRGEPSTHTLRVVAQDTSGTPLRATVRFGHASDADARETVLWNGSATVELESRVWTVRATYDQRELVEAVTLDSSDSSVEFVFEDREVAIRVVDAETGEPIPNANVKIETESYRSTGRTDDDGVWHDQVPFGVDPIEMTVDHEEYTRQVDEVSPNSDTVQGVARLSPHMTAVELCVTTEGDRRTGIPITMVNQHSGTTLEETTNDSGTVRFEDIESGTYRIMPPDTGTEYTLASDRAFLNVSTGEVADVDILLTRE